MKLDHRTIAVSAALFLGTLLVFSRAIGNEFVNYDDPVYVTENPPVQTGDPRIDVFINTGLQAGAWRNENRQPFQRLLDFPNDGLRNNRDRLIERSQKPLKRLETMCVKVTGLKAGVNGTSRLRLTTRSTESRPTNRSR